MLRRYLIVALFTLCGFFKVSAQLPPIFVFSHDPDRFIVQLDSLMQKVTDKKNVSEFNDEFLPFWRSKETPKGYQDIVINTANKLSERRARLFPDYVNYFETVLAFNEVKHWGDSYTNWNRALDDLLDNKSTSQRVVNDLCQNTRNLLVKGVVFSTSAIKWKADTKTFRFEYEENSPLSVTFGNMRLSCVALNKDSITIFDTNGTLNMLTYQWTGRRGRVTWETSGYAANQVFASFKEYQLNMTDSYFQVDSVEFYNRIYFDHSLQGKLEHKILHSSTVESTTYPKFTSYELRYVLKNIYKDVDYEGGFSQWGAKVLGSGTGATPAMIRIYRNDTCFVEAKSKIFALRKDLITSNDAEIKILLAETNVFHPGLIFKFIGSEGRMELIRNGEGLATSPYFDNFHNVTLDVEVISWKNTEPFMVLKGITGAAQNQAFFESLSYYREEFFTKLQGMDRIHPLQGLKNCSNYFGDLPFSVEEYAQFMKLPVSQIRQEIIMLSFNGFIGYNSETDVIQIKDRLSDYLLFRMGRKDFDVIKFNSVTAPNKANAILNLYNYDLSLSGVSSLSISDNQNIIFFPKEEKIILKRNRNFVFDGTINAGMLNLFGDGFEFQYDEFRINLSNIDSLRMKVQSGSTDYYGNAELKNIQNSIAKLSGVLQIDEPNNKSGNKTFPKYPVLKSTKESFVFYQRKDIQDGAYKRDKFYFKLDTFQLDSINQLNRTNFAFNGVFVSSIFPQFREQLVVRKDYSLGFVRSTPKEGLPIYGDRGRYYADIDLSNKGLVGNGKLTYLTSTSKSENFTFLPERTYGLAQTFDVARRDQGVEFPDVKGRYNTIDYYPYQDQFIAKSQENRFEMFNKEGMLEGSITLGPDGATGSGNINLPNSNMVAEKMNFGDHKIHSDSSDFKMMGSDLQNIAFSTTDLVSDIDFKKRSGHFTSLIGGSRVDFTDNKYISFVREFSWNMDKNDIYLGAKGSKGNRFISVHRKQDSLDFLAPLARYDLASKLIEAVEVKSINVADVKIFTKDGVVRIRENADMDPLDSVKIVVQDSTFRHQIYNAKVKILGKKKYTGSGTFDFVNGEDKVIPIRLDLLDVDEKQFTVGFGTILPEALLPLDSHFKFKGDVKFNSYAKNLAFDGGAQMIHNFPQGPRSFLLFKATIDPKNVRIPVNPEPKTYEKESVFKDFFMTKDSIHIYSSYLEGRKKYSDISMLNASGSLFYNKASGAFAITNEAKIDNPDTTGVYFEYTSKTGDVRGEGDFNLGIEYDRIKTRASGTIIDNRKDNKIFMTAMLGVDFYLTQPLINMMVNNIASVQAKESKQSAETFIKRMAEWTGRADAVKLNTKRATFDEYKDMPASVINTLCFGNIDFVWDTPKKSFLADGVFDLSFIKTFPINRQANVKAQFARSRVGNYFDIYIELDENTWYYFAFRNGLMQVLSSNKEWNTLVQTIKMEERKLKSGIGEKPYSFILASEGKKNSFLKRMKSKEDVSEPEDEPVDLDGDGKPDAVDLDGDGKPDKLPNEKDIEGEVKSDSIK